MSEFAAYWYITEKASLEELEQIDTDTDHWPDTFDEFMEVHGKAIKQNIGRSDEDLLEDWKRGVWTGGVVHAIVKIRYGKEDQEGLWWNKLYVDEGVM
ncbi:hypothetical protein H6800_03265 [Candidatus Nomurabacteria bacterium]|nr:hypothetical protein [Candidatus Nomurabacteria bacterium]